MAAVSKLTEADDAFVAQLSDGWTCSQATSTQLLAMHLQDGPLLRRVAQGQTVAVYDIHQTQEWSGNPPARLQGVHSAILSPIRSEEIVVAVHAQPSHFTPRHVALLRAFAQTALQIIESHEAQTARRLQKVAEERAALLEQSQRQLQHQLETISAQQLQIEQLSAPMIRLWKQVVLVPWTGAVCQRVAERLTARVLDEVSQTNTRCVIIDLTAIDEIDAPVVGNLTKMAQAITVLGGWVCLTGIQPKAASMMVDLVEVERGWLKTYSNVEEGLRACPALAGTEWGKHASRK